MPNGIISKGIGGFYYVYFDDAIIECKLRGKFRNKRIIPMVGDRVEIEVHDDNKGVITEIMDRKNQIIRPPTANIDQVIIVFSITHPEPNLLFIDRLITFLEVKGIDIILCINKIDLDNHKKYLELQKLYTDAGFRVLSICAKQNIGIENVIRELDGKITTLAGTSGVGKSTIINDILGTNVLTAELSKKIDRGKHTTRHVELFKLNDGYILDTPGFSMFEISEIDKVDLKYYFREFEEYNDKCKFSGCNHINEPNCEVKDKVSEGIISQSRYNNYKAMFDEIGSKPKYK